MGSILVCSYEMVAERETSASLQPNLNPELAAAVATSLLLPRVSRSRGCVQLSIFFCPWAVVGSWSPGGARVCRPRMLLALVNVGSLMATRLHLEGDWPKPAFRQVVLEVRKETASAI